MSEESRRDAPTCRGEDYVAGDKTSTPKPARDRTLRHMRNLLAGTAVAGTAVNLCGCPDPPPPPLVCSADLTTGYLDQWVYWRARWVQTDSELLILMELDLWDVDSSLAFSGAPTLEDATLTESEFTGTSMTLTLTPPEGATSVAASFPITCEQVNHTLRLVLDVSGTPALGEGVPIAVGE